MRGCLNGLRKAKKWRLGSLQIRVATVSAGLAPVEPWRAKKIVSVMGGHGSEVPAPLVAATTTVALGPAVDNELVPLDALLDFDAMSFAANVRAMPYAGDTLWVVYRARVIIWAQTCLSALTENGRGGAEVTFLTVMTIVGSLHHFLVSGCRLPHVPQTWRT